MSVSLVKLMIMFNIIYLILFYFFISSNLLLIELQKSYSMDFMSKSHVIPYKIINVKNYKNKYVLKAFVNKLTYPIIFKPNTCTANSYYVKKIVDVGSASKYISSYPHDEIMIQDYDNSPHEFAILYERFPYQKHGKIVSLDEKIKVKEYDDITFSVDNSKVVNNNVHITPQLSGVVDKLIKQIVPKVYVGRFDVKAKSLQALKRGEFKVLELNGSFGSNLRCYAEKNDTKSINRLLSPLYTMKWLLTRVYIGFINNLNPINTYNIITKNYVFVDHKKYCSKKNRIIYSHKKTFVSLTITLIIFMILFYKKIDF